MKAGTIIVAIVAVVFISIGSLWHFGFGNSQVGGEAIGQAKKVSNATPVLCPDYTYFDMSMGVLRNGVGSMSTQDMEFTIRSADPNLIALLKDAANSGKIVKVTYNTRRAAVCTEDYILTGAEIVK